MTRAIQFAVEGPEPNKWNTRFPLDGEDKPKSVPSRAPAGVTTQEHYASLTPEPIDVIEGWNLSYCPANAIKYIARAGKKCESGTPTEAAIRDYRKAISYLQRAVNALEGKSGW